MSHVLIDRSPDLARLRGEGFDIEVRGGFLLVKDVPYVNAERHVKRGVLVSSLTLAGDTTVRPDSHVAYFVGDHPCRADGSAILEIKHSSDPQQLAEGVAVQHSFSAKPQPTGYYPDYHAKMTTYVAILSGPAHQLDPSATAKTCPVIPAEANDPDEVFAYLDTASSRAHIGAAMKKLAHDRVAVIGLGGTGAYVLDLVAKTPVREIHLFDGDLFLQHNAFRAPGAASIEALRLKTSKVGYYKNMYSAMRRGIVEHPYAIEASNVHELSAMDFAFVCVDSGPAKRIMVDALESYQCQFVDAGMGIHLIDGALGGILRVTTSTHKLRDHVRTRISFVDGDPANDYATNIQVADLNALNAALAVIKWKKLCGFYRDLKGEHHTTFTLDGNLLLSEERKL